MKEYTGSVYVGVVGGTNEPGTARDSIQGITLRQGDYGPVFARATKGYEGRQMHLNKFIESRADFILFLDHDMIFPADTLERLRAHKLPYVSGLYMRRQANPVMPIWFDKFTGQFPLLPFSRDIDPNQLYELGASGWGCILLHREVVLAVRELLKGEWDIIEDDMDVYPYDLANIMSALRGLRSLTVEQPSKPVLLAAMSAYLDTLEAEIRPLRCDTEPMGSDLRYPFFARLAGYKLYGDPNVSCSHILDYPLSISDYNGFPPEVRDELQRRMITSVNTDRRRMYEQWKAVTNG